MRGLSIVVMVLVTTSAFGAKPQPQIDEFKERVEALEADVAAVGGFYSWTVSDGDIGSVPIPATAY